MTAEPTRPGASTREALLDAAETLFSERGYARVGIRELAEAADANIASIKYHFGSKLELYLETVRRAMRRRSVDDVWQILDRSHGSAKEAAATLTRFIRLFLARVLEEPEEPATCLMLREATQPSEAVDAVVRDFVKPHEGLIVACVRALVPRADPDELPLMAQSILGQIVHYRVFRPFLSRLRASDYDSAASLDRITRYLVRFSLTGLGCRADVVRAGLEEAERLEKEEHDGR
ncbi:MAG: CerR family C-terminal domain-containing protein [Planctomycetota bacterium]